jgi:hypothetical protein
MAHNEDSDLDDDDDQHVHSWQAQQPLSDASSHFDQQSSSHPINTVFGRWWSNVIMRYISPFSYEVLCLIY